MAGYGRRRHGVPALQPAPTQQGAPAVDAGPAVVESIELSTALHCIGEFGQWIRNADAKAAALAAVHCVLLTVLFGELPYGANALNARGPVLASLLSCVLASLAAFACLLGTQLPRMWPPAGPEPSPLAFPTAAPPPAPAATGTPVDAAGLRAQAWQQASTLAGIALAKYRWLRRATFATGLTLATFLVWAVVLVAFAPRP